METKGLKEKIEKIDKLIKKYSSGYLDNGSQIFYDFYFQPDYENFSIKLMIGPINVEGNIGKMASRIIEEKYGVKITSFDSSWGQWYRQTNLQSVFSIIIPEDEYLYDDIFEKLCKAANEYHKEIKRLEDAMTKLIVSAH